MMESTTALKPPKRRHPLIAVIGINDWTETTDYLMAYGILRRAGLCDVVALATQPGPVRLFPALKVQPDATIADFDARHPDGADYVIVPAMSRDDDPLVLDWITRQKTTGAVIIGICEGVKVVAETGLLDSRRATTHWYSVKEMLKKHPSIHYIPNRRWVIDEGVATTTGITASMPMMLTLIEAIGGRDKAQGVANQIGVAIWDANHDSAAFKVTPRFALTVVTNTLCVWKHDRLRLELRPDLDEVSLALVADAWSRTYRSRVLSYAETPGAVQTRNGIRVIPDGIGTSSPNQQLPAIGERPAQALDQTLDTIARRYGLHTAHVVAVQLEYPWPTPAQVAISTAPASCP